METKDAGNLLSSIPETQASLGVSRTTVHELTKAGELVKVVIGRRSLITTASLVAYVDRLAAAATAAAELSEEEAAAV